MTVYVYYLIIPQFTFYRPSCPVRVYASVNDELPSRNEPRYA